MTTRKLPDHGTYARANGSPGYRDACHCDQCRPVFLAAKKRNQVNRRLGRSARVDAAPARAHLEKIRPTMGLLSLEKATGCGRRTLAPILSGERKEISHHTHRKIMAARPASQLDSGIYVDATRTVRQIRAMMVVGHSYRAIAGAAQTSDARIQKVANDGQPTVRWMLAKKIDAIYIDLANNPPPPTAGTTYTRKRAASKGWYGPDFWEDVERIGDPDFDPASVDGPLKRDELAALRREEIEHLAWCGYSPEVICSRLNGELGIKHVREVVLAWQNGAKRNRRKQVAA